MFFSEQIDSEEESTVGSVCHHANKRHGKKSQGNRSGKRDSQQYPAPSHGAQVFPFIDTESADIAPMLAAWYWAGYNSGLYAGHERKKSRAQAPGPHGHCHCEHANA
ncbi:hypothetical protein TNIN_85761 [Trichonephila inaurata madagascariensis]|uniref:Uncharacterized protein n=1 Tax=Trichonephila inaurata madagascariensis TaxID=2747483 RepID=A0A8X6Y0S4_9ARAC|nr:hypothetical protein TNIN_85761 [Trichonephila inaurata madagascariensis]